MNERRGILKNSLSDLIDIKIGDIISVVGSGGKTTFNILNILKSFIDFIYELLFFYQSIILFIHIDILVSFF